MNGSRFRPTRVRVDLDAIRHNVQTLKPDGVELMAVVKANAYGHGDVPVARAALEAGATWLGVALVEEGLGLRMAGVEAPILVLSEAPEGSEAVALAHRLTPTVYSDAGLRRLAAAARGAVAVHVKVDTGMHRVGVWPPEDAPAFLRDVTAAGLQVEGVFTHLAKSEDDEVTTKLQLERLAAVVEAARASGIEPRYVHAANSGGVIRHPESHLDLVRTGIAIYGVPPAPGVGDDLGLRPAMDWSTTVASTRRLDAGERLSYGHRYELERPAWIATAPVGYADGYPRRAWSTAEVLLGGRRRRIAGTVTMDQLLIDCGEDAPEAGDEVVLLGRQGDDAITAWELAVHAGTVGYEIVTRVGSRVPREYAARELTG
jgi:alanine racemase